MRPLLFLLIIVVFSACKKEETEPEEYMPYAKEIIGEWRVVGSVKSSDGTEEVYPNTIDPLLITFTKQSEVDIAMPCNFGGSTTYIVSESGSLSIGEINITSLFCDSQSNKWENRVESSCEGAYHSKISGKSLYIYANSDYDIKLVKQ